MYRRERDHNPLYPVLPRLILVGCIGFILWAGAVVSPFVVAHLFGLQGWLARVEALLSMTGAMVVLIMCLCYLLDRM